METEAYYRALRKRYWLVILACWIGGLAAFYLSVTQTPMYSTTTTLMINPAVPNTMVPYVSAGTVDNLASTYSQFMRTNDFAALVAKAMGPNVSPGTVLGGTSISYSSGTPFFRISATSASPKMAQSLANTTAQVFIQENVKRQQEAQQQTAAAADGSGATIAQERAATLQNLDDERKYYQSQEASLRQQIATLEASPPSATRDQQLLTLRGQLLDVNGLDIKAMSLRADAEAIQTGPVSQKPIDTAVVIDEAPLPSRPISPDTRRNMINGLVFSLVAGLGLVFLLEYLDYTFKTADDLERAYSLPPLGALPLVGKGIVDEQRERVVALLPTAAISESFRMLRTDIQFATLDRSIRSILVTSAIPGEGKTFTAVNLATAMADTGKKVVLVDADLRRPMVHKVFGVGNKQGLTSLLLETPTELDGVLADTETSGLKLLTSGPQPRNPADVLGSTRVAEVLRLLLDVADIVIVDSPPSAILTDSAVLATRVDAVLQVVRAGKTRREIVLKGRDSLARVGANLLGPVLNATRAVDASYYSHNYTVFLWLMMGLVVSAERLGYRRSWASDQNNTQLPSPNRRSLGVLQQLAAMTSSVYWIITFFLVAMGCLVAIIGVSGWMP